MSTPQNRGGGGGGGWGWGYICVPLTDCINSGILNGVFPDGLKLADVTPLYKKSDPKVTDKRLTITIQSP